MNLFTGEIHYHDFINFAGDIFLVSIGHYESEHAIKHYLWKNLLKNLLPLPFQKPKQIGKLFILKNLYCKKIKR
jgi:putative NIF3 family GTP cyclohydrolase 1 type 2